MLSVIRAVGGETMNSFAFAATPHIHFGVGARQLLPGLVAGFGSRVLLVSGGASFDASDDAQILLKALQSACEVRRLRVTGEPSPQLVDAAVSEHAGWQPDCVVAIGGGSCVDAAKAIAGLLPSGDSVMAYLEGVGEGKQYAGPATPFIAMPTTAGTGGETSKNAVLSVIGEHGFKKSFRDEQLVPHTIILDPELCLSCPPAVTAACGMDALTQLLESLVSTSANPMTDALAISGLSRIRQGLLRAVEDGTDLDARAAMLYASSMSGLTLANAGLGSVHGLAAPLGALFPIPHGVVCGTLVAAAARQNINLLRAADPAHPLIRKYAEAGRVLLGDAGLADATACTGLMELLDAWTEQLKMPLLSAYGITRADFSRIIADAGGGMKTNPVVLTDEQAADLLLMRL